MIPSLLVNAARPTDQEINGKLAAAKREIAQNAFADLRPGKIRDDLVEPDLYSNDEIQPALISAFGEIRNKDYKGSRFSECGRPNLYRVTFHVDRPSTPERRY